MLFKRTALEGIARGEITLAFRRWKKPTVSSGSRVRTAFGEVLIGDIHEIDDPELSDEETRKAGYASLAELRDTLHNDDERKLYRIEILGIEADQRAALRENMSLSHEEAAAISERLSKWDRANGMASYHHRILDAIAKNESAPAGNLAEELGVEKLKFKRDVRKLKELGLTESLETGYRLAPRGRVFLDMIGDVG